MTESPRFPEFFPVGCPPAGALDANQIVFRLVATNPPSEDDFLTHAELGKGSQGDPCLRCGLSVFPNSEAARTLFIHMRSLYGDGILIGRFIAKCNLSEKHGKLKQTRKPPHMTWWVYDGLLRSDGFLVIEEITNVES